jgi:hypothetical protein
MQVAFNFDEEAYHEVGDGKYPAPLGVLAAEAIAQTIPSHRRHCAVQIGSVQPYPESWMSDAEKRGAALIKLPPRWHGFLYENAFVRTIGKGGLCAIVISGLSPQDATAIDDRWHSATVPGYIGSFEILRGHDLHEALYFMSLPRRYSIYKDSLAFLVEPQALEGDGDYDDDQYRQLGNALPAYGITDIRLQSTGLTDSLWDPYAANFDFAQVIGRVERTLQGYTDGIITEITLRARDADPRLLETLDAALVALNGEPGQEFISQAALSCRRFLERLADVLYPPKETAEGERKLGQAQYVNRLWAYVAQTLGPNGSKTALKEIGHRIDRLSEIANKGLHDDISVDEMDRLVVNLALLTHDLLKLAAPTGVASESYSTTQVSEVARTMGPYLSSEGS